MGTVASIYPGTAGGQSVTNIGRGSAKVPTRQDFDVPLLPGLSRWSGLSIPTLIAVGFLAWFLIERYD
jgi:hypothetical protein